MHNSPAAGQDQSSRFGSHSSEESGVHFSILGRFPPHCLLSPLPGDSAETPITRDHNQNFVFRQARQSDRAGQRAHLRFLYGFLTRMLVQ
jgi:hypothetical protein